MTEEPKIEAVVDVARLSKWLRHSEISDGVITNLRQLPGGTQNVLLRFHSGGRDMVLRRPPLKQRPKNNELILREATVLAALTDTDIPHARLIGVCNDPAVLGSAVFYLMDAVDGFNPAAELEGSWATPQGCAHLARQATATLADIGALDHDRLGLTGFGRPQGFLERQVPRWVRELDSYRDTPGFEAEPLPGYAVVRDHLAAHVPTTFRPGLMHGDYHFGNLLFGRSDGVLAAVLDWEMSTVGDPLVDFGRYLAMWPDGDDVIIQGDGVWKGTALPSPADLVEIYAASSGLPMDDLPWYVIMGCFKLGIILDGTYARSCAGLVPPPIGRALHETAVRLFQRAIRLVEDPNGK